MHQAVEANADYDAWFGPVHHGMMVMPMLCQDGPHVREHTSTLRTSGQPTMRQSLPQSNPSSARTDSGLGLGQASSIPSISHSSNSRNNWKTLYCRFVSLYIATKQSVHAIPFMYWILSFRHHSYLAVGQKMRSNIMSTGPWWLPQYPVQLGLIPTFNAGFEFAEILKFKASTTIQIVYCVVQILYYIHTSFTQLTCIHQYHTWEIRYVEVLPAVPWAKYWAWENMATDSSLQYCLLFSGWSTVLWLPTRIQLHGHLKYCLLWGGPSTVSRQLLESCKVLPPCGGQITFHASRIQCLSYLKYCLL
jgi:hypothetical protein